MNRAQCKNIFVSNRSIVRKSIALFISVHFFFFTVLGSAPVAWSEEYVNSAQTTQQEVPVSEVAAKVSPAPTPTPSPWYSSNPLTSPASGDTVPDQTASPVPVVSPVPVPTNTPLIRPSIAPVPVPVIVPTPAPVVTPLPVPTTNPVPVPTTTPLPEPSLVALPEPDQNTSSRAIELAKTNLSEQLNLTDAQEGDIQVVAAESNTWNDGCVGWYLPGQFCTMAIVSDYQVKLKLYQNEYEFHAGRLDPAKQAALIAIADVLQSEISASLPADLLSRIVIEDSELIEDPTAEKQLFNVVLHLAADSNAATVMRWVYVVDLQDGKVISVSVNPSPVPAPSASPSPVPTNVPLPEPTVEPTASPISILQAIANYHGVSADKIVVYEQLGYRLALSDTPVQSLDGGTFVFYSFTDAEKYYGKNQYWTATLSLTNKLISAQAATLEQAFRAEGFHALAAEDPDLAFRQVVLSKIENVTPEGIVGASTYDLIFSLTYGDAVKTVKAKGTKAVVPFQSYSVKILPETPEAQMITRDELFKLNPGLVTNVEAMAGGVLKLEGAYLKLQADSVTASGSAVNAVYELIFSAVGEGEVHMRAVSASLMELAGADGQGFTTKTYELLFGASMVVDSKIVYIKQNVISAQVQSGVQDFGRVGLGTQLRLTVRASITAAVMPSVPGGVAGWWFTPIAASDQTGHAAVEVALAHADELQGQGLSGIKDLKIVEVYPVMLTTCLAGAFCANQDYSAKISYTIGEKNYEAVYKHGMFEEGKGSEWRLSDIKEVVPARTAEDALAAIENVPADEILIYSKGEIACIQSIPGYCVTEAFYSVTKNGTRFYHSAHLVLSGDAWKATDAVPADLEKGFLAEGLEVLKGQPDLADLKFENVKLLEIRETASATLSDTDSVTSVNVEGLSSFELTYEVNTCKAAIGGTSSASSCVTKTFEATGTRQAVFELRSGWDEAKQDWIYKVKIEPQFNDTPIRSLVAVDLAATLGLSSAVIEKYAKIEVDPESLTATVTLDPSVGNSQLLQGGAPLADPLHLTKLPGEIVYHLGLGPQMGLACLVQSDGTTVCPPAVYQLESASFRVGTLVYELDYLSDGITKTDGGVIAKRLYGDNLLHSVTVTKVLLPKCEVVDGIEKCSSPSTPPSALRQISLTYDGDSVVAHIVPVPASETSLVMDVLISRNDDKKYHIAKIDDVVNGQVVATSGYIYMVEQPPQYMPCSPDVTNCVIPHVEAFVRLMEIVRNDAKGNLLSSIHSINEMVLTTDETALAAAETDQAQVAAAQDPTLVAVLPYQGPVYQATVALANGNSQVVTFTTFAGLLEQVRKLELSNPADQPARELIVADLADTLGLKSSAIDKYVKIELELSSLTAKVTIDPAAGLIDLNRGGVALADPLEIKQLPTTITYHLGLGPQMGMPCRLTADGQAICPPVVYQLVSADFQSGELAYRLSYLPGTATDEAVLISRFGDNRLQSARVFRALPRECATVNGVEICTDNTEASTSISLSNLVKEITYKYDDVGVWAHIVRIPAANEKLSSYAGAEMNVYMTRGADGKLHIASVEDVLNGTVVATAAFLYDAGPLLVSCAPGVVCPPRDLSPYLVSITRNSANGTVLSVITNFQVSPLEIYPPVYQAVVTVKDRKQNVNFANLAELFIAVREIEQMEDKNVQVAKNKLGELLNLSDVQMKAIEVVKVEKTVWNNGCLGWSVPGEMCTMMMVEGFRVVLKLYGNEYEFHAGRLDPAKDAAIVAINDLVSRGRALSAVSILYSQVRPSVSTDATGSAVNQVLFDVKLSVATDTAAGELWHYVVDYRSHTIVEVIAPVDPVKELEALRQRAQSALDAAKARFEKLIHAIDTEIDALIAAIGSLNQDEAAVTAVEKELAAAFEAVQQLAAQNPDLSNLLGEAQGLFGDVSASIQQWRTDFGLLVRYKESLKKQAVYRQESYAGQAEKLQGMFDELMKIEDVAALKPKVDTFVLATQLQMEIAFMQLPPPAVLELNTASLVEHVKAATVTLNKIHENMQVLIQDIAQQRELAALKQQAQALFDQTVARIGDLLQVITNRLQATDSEIAQLHQDSAAVAEVEEGLGSAYQAVQQLAAANPDINLSNWVGEAKGLFDGVTAAIQQWRVSYGQVAQAREILKRTLAAQQERLTTQRGNLVAMLAELLAVQDVAAFQAKYALFVKETQLGDVSNTGAISTYASPVPVLNTRDLLNQVTQAVAGLHQIYEQALQYIQDQTQQQELVQLKEQAHGIFTEAQARLAAQIQTLVARIQALEAEVVQLNQDGLAVTEVETGLANAYQAVEQLGSNHPDVDLANLLGEAEGLFGDVSASIAQWRTHAGQALASRQALIKALGLQKGSLEAQAAQLQAKFAELVAIQDVEIFKTKLAEFIKLTQLGYNTAGDGTAVSASPLPYPGDVIGAQALIDHVKAAIETLHQIQAQIQERLQDDAQQRELAALRQEAQTIFDAAKGRFGTLIQSLGAQIEALIAEAAKLRQDEASVTEVQSSLGAAYEQVLALLNQNPNVDLADLAASAEGLFADVSASVTQWLASSAGQIQYREQYKGSLLAHQQRVKAQLELLNTMFAQLQQIQDVAVFKTKLAEFTQAAGISVNVADMPPAPRLGELNAQSMIEHVTAAIATLNQIRQDILKRIQDDPKPAIAKAVDTLVAALNLTAEQKAAIQVVKTEKAGWTNGCVGWSVPGQMCTMMMVDGFRVVLKLYGNEYEFHAGRLDPAKDAAIVAIKDWITKGKELSTIVIVSSALTPVSADATNAPSAIFDIVLTSGQAKVLYQVNYFSKKIISFKDLNPVPLNQALANYHGVSAEGLLIYETIASACAAGSSENSASCVGSGLKIVFYSFTGEKYYGKRQYWVANVGADNAVLSAQEASLQQAFRAEGFHALAAKEPNLTIGQVILQKMENTTPDGLVGSAHYALTFQVTSGGQAKTVQANGFKAVVQFQSYTVEIAESPTVKFVSRDDLLKQNPRLVNAAEQMAVNVLRFKGAYVTTLATGQTVFELAYAAAGAGEAHFHAEANFMELAGLNGTGYTVRAGSSYGASLVVAAATDVAVIEGTSTALPVVKAEVKAGTQDLGTVAVGSEIRFKINAAGPNDNEMTAYGKWFLKPIASSDDVGHATLEAALAHASELGQSGMLGVKNLKIVQQYPVPLYTCVPESFCPYEKSRELIEYQIGDVVYRALLRIGAFEKYKGLEWRLSNVQEYLPTPDPSVSPTPSPSSNSSLTGGSAITAQKTLTLAVETGSGESVTVKSAEAVPAEESATDEAVTSELKVTPVPVQTVAAVSTDKVNADAALEREKPEPEESSPAPVAKGNLTAAGAMVPLQNLQNVYERSKVEVKAKVTNAIAKIQQRIVQTQVQRKLRSTYQLNVAMKAIAVDMGTSTATVSLPASQVVFGFERANNNWFAPYNLTLLSGELEKKQS